LKINFTRVLSVLLIVIGVVYFLPFINFNSDTLIGIIFLAWGFTGVLLSFGRGKSALLFISVILFLLGVELLLPEFFIIRMSGGFISMSLMMLLGFAFLVLFIDNTKEKIFLSLAIGFLLFGYLVPNLPRLYWLSRFFDRLGLLFMNLWPIILIVIGIGFLLESNKNS